MLKYCAGGCLLLAIDIGNTNVALGIFRGEELVATWRISTDLNRMPDEYTSMLLTLFPYKGLKTTDIKGAIICSVVPPLVGTFEEMCRDYFKVSPLIVEAGIKTGIRIAMDNPREVGADRVVNALAVYHLYGAPAIVIDLGTATTFDIVSESGDYLGGVIAPGIGIAAEALFMRTAKLPRVELEAPQHVIGKNTVSAMQSGLIFGYVGLIEGLVGRIQAELKAKARVIATGGLAGIITKQTPIIEKVEPNLTLFGLRMMYEMNRPLPGHEPGEQESEKRRKTGKLFQ